MDRKQRGDSVEKAAVAFLRSKGYEVIVENYRCPEGELDIVCRDGEEIVFVEVRSRADARFGGALYAVSQAKQQQVARVAQAFLSRTRSHSDTCRFDVVAVTGDEIEHIIDAFRA